MKEDERTVELSIGKKINIKPAKYRQTAKIADCELKSDQTIMMMKISIVADNVDEVIDSLSTIEGVELTKELNKLYGAKEDFLSEK